MADTILVHFIFRAKGPALQAIVDDISQHQRLVTSGGWHGHGVYAYFADEVPASVEGTPGVEFETQADRVRDERRHGNRMAFIPVSLNECYFPIRVRRFINLP